MYEISDHGGLIILVKDDGVTNKLNYSYDEGLSWTTIEFHDKPI